MDDIPVGLLTDQFAKPIDPWTGYAKRHRKVMAESRCDGAGLSQTPTTLSYINDSNEWTKQASAAMIE